MSRIAALVVLAALASPALADPPSKFDPAPTVAVPGAPSTEPAPTVAEPAPTVAEPAPTVAEPAPTVAEPAPTVARFAQLLDRARALMDKGDAAAAIALLEKARTLRPAERAPLEALCETYEAVGRIADALAACRALSVMAPDDPALRQKLKRLEGLAPR